jgi:hypothetical protein
VLLLMLMLMLMLPRVPRVVGAAALCEMAHRQPLRVLQHANGPQAA